MGADRVAQLLSSYARDAGQDDYRVRGACSVQDQARDAKHPLDRTLGYVDVLDAREWDDCVDLCPDTVRYVDLIYIERPAPGRPAPPRRDEENVQSDEAGEQNRGPDPPAEPSLHGNAERDACGDEQDGRDDCSDVHYGPLAGFQAGK